MTFGVIPTAPGFLRPTFAELRQQVVDDILANVGPLVDTSEAAAFGRIVDIYTTRLDTLWGELELVYKSNDPDAALTDARLSDALASIAKLTGTPRRGASFSTVVIECTLAAGTELRAGTHFVSVDGRPDVRFTLASDFT